MLWIIAAAQVLDIVSFAAAVAVIPVQYEQNPFVRFMFETFGILGLFAYKGALMAAMLVIVSRLMRSDHPVMQVVSVSISTAWGLAGTAANLTSLYVTLRLLP